MNWLDKMGDVVGRAFIRGVVFWPVKCLLLLLLPLPPLPPPPPLLPLLHKVFCVVRVFFDRITWF